MHDRRLQREPAARAPRLRADRCEPYDLRGLQRHHGAARRDSRADRARDDARPRVAPAVRRAGRGGRVHVGRVRASRHARRAGGRLPAARALVSGAALVGSGGRSAAHCRAGAAVAFSSSRPSAEGPIVAGNVNTLLLLHGTPWWPSLDDAIALPRGRRGIRKAVDRRAPARPAAPARRVARTPPVSRTGGSIRQSRLRVRPPGSTRSSFAPRPGHRLPVAVGLDFSHTDPLLTLPWGVRARLEAGDEVTLELLEPAVV